MKNYNYLNNLTGWVVFIIASAVYLLTIEPTASFWDCGEFIASSYKLQVGHPPGAPLFMMLGRLFTLAAGNDVSKVAMWVNIMSALCSSFTILFLFWTITAFAKKVAVSEGELSTSKIIAVLGSGVVGALAYTFSDSFWFSAVEGEVYAMSSFFTAAVFWAMLKWESVADKPHSDRWLILIAYLMGLSVGVHLLNLLCIPALAFIYYFKKYEFSWSGFFLTTIAGVGLLVFIQYGIIPGVVIIASKFEMLFVNSFRLPFNSGLLVYGLAITALVSFGLYFTSKQGLRLANTALLCLTVILIGYSSYAMIVIRSAAKPPMNENEPSDVYSLLSYLNREQYGDRPLTYGQYYDTPLKIDEEKREYVRKDNSPVYYQGKDKNGKDTYLIADDRKNSIPVYDPKFCTIFPRMYSSSQHHIAAYKNWANIKGRTIKVKGRLDGITEVEMPTFGENLTFFFKYQVGHMYLRYFMWNFAGRQNNIQGHGSILEGNFITGIPFLDEAMVGSQDNLPEYLAKNKGMNKFYLLPLIIGILGLVWQANRDKKDFFVVFLLFIFTGLAIVVYLNQYPYQPRERDYAYAASFYAFAIWIGFGVYSVFDFIGAKLPSSVAAQLATALCLLGAPVLMAKDGWDDHSRAGRYSARDFAMNYLNSCEPNAILFTNGDNDTFPLWYAQDVEGIRTDVRVVNLSLLATDWYIDQMKQKAYESEPLPISFTTDQYREGTRDYLPVEEITNKAVNLKDVMKIAGSESPNAKNERGMNFIPSRKLYIPVDSAQVVNSGYVPKDAAGLVVKQVEWELDKSYVGKNDLILLDILANNNWKRPVYFAVTVGGDNYLGLSDYFQMDGMTYKVVPIKTTNENNGYVGRVNTTAMYDNVMNKYKWGGMKDSTLYMDPETIRLTSGLRLNMARLASTLAEENKKDSAVKVLDLCIQEMPDNTIPYNYLMVSVAEAYYKAGANEKGNAILLRLAAIFEKELTYYFSLDRDMMKMVEDEIRQDMTWMNRSASIAKGYKQTEVGDKIAELLEKIMQANESKMGDKVVRESGN